ncbi:hypothetical protein CHCC15091_2055 [Bacillus licheniformis]|nr:hypothetical protein CHCC20339_0260 [Bacillus licheniformis]TWM15014.1 hypothetical protein CHCC15091_2055 [Bacillus licheniformis]TWM40542.1 hypothetical protein CHCC14818_0383 [Bacillus licheniformis]TWM99686.1 hypothetical protein CHCC14566_3071 [Bacillus licheniformis]
MYIYTKPDTMLSGFFLYDEEKGGMKHETWNIIFAKAAACR